MEERSLAGRARVHVERQTLMEVLRPVRQQSVEKAVFVEDLHSVVLDVEPSAAFTNFLGSFSRGTRAG